MDHAMNIDYQLETGPKLRKTPFVPDGPLGFGKARSNHMFLMDFSEGQWHDARIVPYGPMPNIMPGAVCLQYGQEIFEGIKAFKHPDNELYTFRIMENARRLNHSADIMCMPHIPIEDQITAVHTLLDVDRLWYPDQEGAALYIRPFMIGTEDSVQVHESATYTFGVFLSPSGAYYPQGFNDTIPLLITKRFHRAVRGGTGSAKAGGNYGGTLRPAALAKSWGAKQVLYLDEANVFIEEAGAMNHYHVTRDGTVVIPEFTETILKSVTATSMIELSDRLGHKVIQESITLDEFIDGVRSGDIVEAGGLGTGAGVAPVGRYIFDDGSEPIIVGNGKIGEVSRNMYDLLTGIQRGKLSAPKDWLQPVLRRN